MSIKLYQSIRDLLKYFGFQRNYKIINHFFPRVPDNHASQNEEQNIACSKVTKVCIAPLIILS